jgi:tetratricopeptide (TPR) repeat protein
MTQFDPIRHKAATAIFKMALKTLESGMHRTLNRDPKGKGWVSCAPHFEGIWCRPDKVEEAIEYFKIAYEVFPDIVALNQIAIAYETLGKYPLAIDFFARMKEQANLEGNDVYVQAADAGLGRCE